MRKLSLLIIALSATLGASAVQADDAVDTGATTDTPEVVPYLPPESTGTDPQVVTDPVVVDEAGGGDDPVVVVDPPVDSVCEDCVEVTGTSDPDVSTGTTDESGATKDGSSDETGSTDEAKPEEPVLNPEVMYTTTGRPEDCMQCRTLTGADSGAVEAPAPEVTADVLDGNATGVDVMDPVDAKKRK